MKSKNDTTETIEKQFKKFKTELEYFLKTHHNLDYKHFYKIQVQNISNELES
jgi:hypothetical protein